LTSSNRKERAVITNISLITLWVTNQDAARDFYTSKLGFTAKDDVKLGDGFRWGDDHPSPDTVFNVVVEFALVRRGRRVSRPAEPFHERRGCLQVAIAEDEI
jgi:catechol 2,3-dioxygenase-like lactoylglutathione lyase family enzyme